MKLSPSLFAAAVVASCTAFTGPAGAAAIGSLTGIVRQVAPPPSTECVDVCNAQSACNSACTVSLHTLSVQNGVSSDAVTEVQNQTCGGYGECSLYPAAAIALAANVCESLPPWADGLVHYSKVFNRSDSFGGDRFGGGYTVDGRLESNATSIDRSRSNFLGRATGNAWGRVFGSQRELAYGLAEVSTPYASNNGGFQAEVRLGGVSVYRAVKGAGPSAGNPTYTRTIFSMSLPFQVGPATVNVSGSAGVAASMPYRFDWGLIADRINLQATPTFTATATATASVGVGVNLGIVTTRVEAGVTGNLTLVTVRLPAVASITLTSVNGAYRLDWNWNLPLELTALAGKIDVFVRGIAGVCIPYVGCADAEVARYTRTIARFDGLAYNTNLGNGSGCVNLPGNNPNAVLVGGAVMAAAQ